MTSLADDSAPFEWTKSNLDETLNISTPFGFPPTNHDIIIMNAFLLDQRFAAIVDYSYVSVIENRVFNTFLPMISHLPIESMYAAYEIDIESLKGQVRALIEAINFIKATSIITVGITNEIVSSNASEMTLGEFNEMIDVMNFNINQANRLYIGDYDSIRAANFWVDVLASETHAVADTMLNAYHQQDINMVFSELQRVSDLDIACQIVYPYSNIDEQISFVNRLRVGVPFALRRVALLVSSLNAMPDYRMYRNDLFGNGFPRGIGFNESEV